MYHLLLSSGRTGTTFLTDAINFFCPEVRVLQEPIPSRTIYMLANAADHGFPTRKAARVLHWLSQQVWQRSPGENTIEVNPFVSPIAHLLKPTRNITKVLMMVRHPDFWIESMLAFRGYAWRAKVTPYLPFVYSRPVEARLIWRDLSEEEKFAWRWVEINRNILECAQNGFDMLIIRYEDLFGAQGVDFSVLRSILDFYGFKEDIPLSAEHAFRFRKNPSSRTGNTAWFVRKPELKAAVGAITGSMRRRFGYE